MEAKSEYTKQLNSIMADPITNAFALMYDTCVAIPTNERNVNYLVEMQKKMKEIPGWNTFKIENETKSVIQHCPYFSDLLAAVFVSNVKILTSIRVGKSNKKVQIKMRSNEDFVHNVYVNVAEAIYNNPYIFKKESVVYKKDIRLLISEAIDNTIRTLLPLQHILQNYIGNGSDSEEESGSEPDPDPNPDPDAQNSPEVSDDEMQPPEDDDESTPDACDDIHAEEEHHTEPQIHSQPPIQNTPNNDFFGNEHEIKKVQLENKASPFAELKDEDA